jgi:hypothetical protein
VCAVIINVLTSMISYRLFPLDVPVHSCLGCDQVCDDGSVRGLLIVTVFFAFKELGMYYQFVLPFKQI